MSTSTEPGIARKDSGQPDRGLPSLLYGETEEELRAAVRGLLEERAAWSDVLARTETAQTTDAALWRTLAAEVGCAGLLIPESHGGAETYKIRAPLSRGDDGSINFACGIPEGSVKLADFHGLDASVPPDVMKAVQAKFDAIKSGKFQVPLDMSNVQ